MRDIQQALRPGHDGLQLNLSYESGYFFEYTQDLWHSLLAFSDCNLWEFPHVTIPSMITSSVGTKECFLFGRWVLPSVAKI